MSLLTSLVSYFKLDEASGDALDAHGSNNLTDFNSVGSAAGIIAGSRNFVRASSKFLRTSMTPLVTATVPLSVSCWIRLTSGGINQNVLSGGTNASANFAWGLGVTTANKLIFYASNGAGSFDNIIGSSTLSTGTWYHAVIVWRSATDREIYLNAVSDGTGSTSRLPSAGADRFALGTYFDIGGSDYWNGDIDETGVWARELLAGEITDLYNGGAGLSYDDFGHAQVDTPIPKISFGPPLRGAPWIPRILPPAEPVYSTPVGTEPNTNRAIQIVTGPPMLGAPWGAGGFPFAPIVPPVPPVPPPPTNIGNDKTLISYWPRQGAISLQENPTGGSLPVVVIDSRIRRSSEILADIHNSLMRNGQLVKIGLNEWTLSVSNFEPFTSGLSGLVPAAVATPRHFATQLELLTGVVIGTTFEPIAPEDLPRPPGLNAGGYISPSLVVDQTGRVTAIAGGFVRTTEVAAPASVSIGVGECAMWFDATAGAAKVMFKARDSAGNIVTASVNLA